MTTLRQLMAPLRGKTTDEIAALVGAREIVGRVESIYQCPMALLLDRGHRLAVGKRYIARRLPDGEIEKMRTPPNIAAFMRAFDEGHYPDLIAPPREVVPKSGRRRLHRGGQRTRPPVRVHLAKLVGRFEP